MGLNFITTAEHAMAIAAQNIVRDWKYVESKVLPALQDVEAKATSIEAVTGLVSESAANIEKAAFGVLGFVIKAIQDVTAAAAGGGLNVSLDASVVADIKSIIPAVMEKAATTTPPTTK